ncbi:hypothetical protein FH972_021920 [Carpinus fangiana]|uniref:FAD dependent oxidoreductase domain-containing protein n=1 Tax=Carpinus fangiana TaxID=176857 RepID=A0A5N6KSW9_9ROSI|nr:hypothetical protein FH972_021920 [Carpinus fangiana]
MALPGSNTVILGAGIIGTSTAYYLSQSPNTPAKSIHIVETTPQLFSSASGYAGGFLARDWFGPALAELGALSFDLHHELAEQHGGRQAWGWSWSQATSIANLNDSGHNSSDWLRHGASRAQLRTHHVFGHGTGPGSAQTVSIPAEREFRSWRITSPSCARLVNIERHQRRVGVDPLPCTRLIITAGAWTPEVFSALFPNATLSIPISQLGGHSVLVRSDRFRQEHEDLSCHAVFATDESGFSPEIFSRVGGEIYIAGLNDHGLPLPKNAAAARPDPIEIEKLMKFSRSILGLEEGDDLEVEKVMAESLSQLDMVLGVFPNL